jgi:thioredoxin reductase
MEIMNNFKEHALKTGTEIIYDMVFEIKKLENSFEIKTSM